MWLITAGPTREYLDDVRFLSNASSGRMAYCLAEAARDRGEKVVLLSGPVSLSPPENVEHISVVSANEMREVGARILSERQADVLLGVAAVCDFRPKKRVLGKPPKERGGFSLELVENPDVLSSLVALGRSRLNLGFALEDFEGPTGLSFDRAVQRARIKLHRKGLNGIILNPIPQMESEAGTAYWVTEEEAPRFLGAGQKRELAERIIDAVLALKPG
jgi:phosphopantothenoylcysteine decarboxylase/phosphopantothenate--cysteine ligase